MKEATLTQALHLLKLASDQGVSEKHLQDLINLGVISDVLRANPENVDRDALRAACRLKRARRKRSKKAEKDIFPVTIDHTRPIKQMIANGDYDWVNDDITEEHFPREKTKGKEKVDLELIHFNKSISSDNAIAELKKLGMRPATLPELLAFGAAYTNKQREFPIVALGSAWRVWYDSRSVPCLWSGSVGRYLDLGWLGGGWRESYRFLAVREV